ncbi:MAG: hypothetical protein WDO13_03025 [Verrucomicrobiota bacterium]
MRWSSAGHTGALVAVATIRLRMLPGIDRPGLAALMPTQSGLFPAHRRRRQPRFRPEAPAPLCIMGSVYSREVLKVSNPRVGLLNIGSESNKGNELTKAA